MTVACSILSLLGSLFIIVLYLTIKSLRIFYAKIIFFIAISELLRSICYLIPCNYITSMTLINIIALVSDSTFLISIVWSAYISITLYKLILSYQEGFKDDYKYWCYFTWVFIPIINVGPIFTNSHGVRGTICTYSFDKVGNIWRLAGMYIPVWIFIIGSLIVCCKIYHISSCFDIENEKKLMVRKLFLYPILLIIEVGPMTIGTVLVDYTTIQIPGVFWLITFCLYALHGFTNAVIYGFTIGLKNIIGDYYRSCISLKDQQSYKLRIESCEGPNLLYSTFNESVNNN